MFVNAVALGLADHFFKGLAFIGGFKTLVLAALIFGLLNTFIKPLLIFLTLPINLLTLGLFTLVINAAILRITASMLNAFYIRDFGIAFLAALFISIVSIPLNLLIRDR